MSAFGDFLLAQGQGNAYRLAKELKAEGVDEASSVTILRGVIDTILDREAGKFPVQNSLQPLATFKPFDREFQEDLLGAVAAGSPAGCSLSDVNSLTGQLGRKRLESDPDFATLAELARSAATQDYLENLRKKVELHPFLDLSQDRVVFRNPIYREYYVAKYAVDHPDVPLPTILGADVTASYYLALFLLSLVPDRNLSAHHDSVFFVLRLLVASGREDAYQIDVTFDAEAAVWFARVESDSLRVAPFQVSGDSILALPFPADAVFQNFSLDGGDKGIIALSGPDGYDTRSPILLSQGAISGAEVELDAAAFTLDTLNLKVQRLTFADRLMELNGLDTLTIDWQENGQIHASEYARNRWDRELAGAASRDTSNPTAFQGKLKKLLLWFRKHGRDEYGVYRPRFYTCATNKRRDRLAMRIAEFLFEKSILEDGELIVLKQTRLAEYGVYYGKQNELKFGQGFQKLFELWQEFDRLPS